MNILTTGDSGSIARILEFLTYSGVDAVSSYDAESDSWQITVPQDQLSKAEMLLTIYRSQPEEAASDPENAVNSDTEKPSEKKRRSSSNEQPFVASSEKFKERIASAQALIGAGAFMGLFLILCMARILPLPLTFDRQPVMVVFIGMLSICSLIYGIHTFRQADTYKSQMTQEAALEHKIRKWFTETYTGAALDQIIEAAEGDVTSEEVLCLKRLSLIHDYLIREYPELTDNHAAALSETLYQDLYEA